MSGQPLHKRSAAPREKLRNRRADVFRPAHTPANGSRKARRAP
jgi:hypothetical protein